MMRPLGFWIALCACLALPAFALALPDDDDDDDESSLGANTDGGLSVQLFIDNTAVDLQDPDPLGKRACDENWPLVFEVTGFATGSSSAPLVEVWYGDGCQNSSKRDLVEENDCTQIGEAEDRNESDLEQTFTIPMVEFCDLKGDIRIYFLPVESVNSSRDISTYGVYKLSIDTSPPGAPTNVRSKPGETEIPIDWNLGDDNVFQNFLVWDTAVVSPDDLEGVDAGSGTSGDCASATLIPGADLDLSNLPDTTHQEMVGNVRSHTLDGTRIGADRVVLGIVAEDRAGNRSVLSNVTCVSVVLTDGFWDGYKNAGGDIEEGCACSLPGASSRTNRLAFVPLLLAAVLVALRIRRKRSS